MVLALLLILICSTHCIKLGKPHTERLSAGETITVSLECADPQSTKHKPEHEGYGLSLFSNRTKNSFTVEIASCQDGGSTEEITFGSYTTAPLDGCVCNGKETEDILITSRNAEETVVDLVFFFSETTTMSFFSKFPSEANRMENHSQHNLERDLLYSIVLENDMGQGDGTGTDLALEVITKIPITTGTKCTGTVQLSICIDLAIACKEGDLNDRTSNMGGLCEQLMRASQQDSPCHFFPPIELPTPSTLSLDASDLLAFDADKQGTQHFYLNAVLYNREQEPEPTQLCNSIFMLPLLFNKISMLDKVTGLEQDRIYQFKISKDMTNNLYEYRNMIFLNLCNNLDASITAEKEEEIGYIAYYGISQNSEIVYQILDKRIVHNAKLLAEEPKCYVVNLADESVIGMIKNMDVEEDIVNFVVATKYSTSDSGLGKVENLPANMAFSTYLSYPLIFGDSRGIIGPATKDIPLELYVPSKQQYSYFVAQKYITNARKVPSYSFLAVTGSSLTEDAGYIIRDSDGRSCFQFKEETKVKGEKGKEESCKYQGITLFALRNEDDQYSVKIYLDPASDKESMTVTSIISRISLLGSTVMAERITDNELYFIEVINEEHVGIGIKFTIFDLDDDDCIILTPYALPNSDITLEELEKLEAERNEEEEPRWVVVRKGNNKPVGLMPMCLFKLCSLFILRSGHGVEPFVYASIEYNIEDEHAICGPYTENKKLTAEPKSSKATAEGRLIYAFKFDNAKFTCEHLVGEWHNIVYQLIKPKEGKESHTIESPYELTDKMKYEVVNDGRLKYDILECDLPEEGKAQRCEWTVDIEPNNNLYYLVAIDDVTKLMFLYDTVEAGAQSLTDVTIGLIVGLAITAVASIALAITITLIMYKNHKAKEEEEEEAKDEKSSNSFWK